jgi:hypothetical protein
MAISMIVRHWVSLLLAALLLQTSSAADAGKWQAGVAKVSITSREAVWMAGHAAPTGPSDGSLIELYARSIVLVDAKGTRNGCRGSDRATFASDRADTGLAIRDRTTSLRATPFPNGIGSASRLARWLRRAACPKHPGKIAQSG